MSIQYTVPGFESFPITTRPGLRPIFLRFLGRLFFVLFGFLFLVIF